MNVLSRKLPFQEVDSVKARRQLAPREDALWGVFHGVRRRHELRLRLASGAVPNYLDGGCGRGVTQEAKTNRRSNNTTLALLRVRS